MSDSDMSMEDLLGELSLLDLFGAEIESLTGVLSNGLLTLERDPSALEGIEELMRAAHSAKGAARIAQLDPIVTLAHTMEDYFVAVQAGELLPTAEHTDFLLAAVDIMAQLAKVPPGQFQGWISERESEIDERVSGIASLLAGSDSAGTGRPSTTESPSPSGVRAEPTGQPSPETPLERETVESRDRVVRLTSESLDRLMSLAGEVRIDTRWLRPFSDSLLQLKSGQTFLADVLEGLRNNLDPGTDIEALNEAVEQLDDNRRMLIERLDDLETFARRSTDLSSRLYREVIDSRMRPFSDGAQAFPRMLRDLARSLGKKIRFDIVGADTEVDRDILEKLEAPLTHLLRNSVDHGLETSEERLAAGKAEEGAVRLEARHAGGMLSIEVADDGRGIDLPRIREKVISLELADAEIASRLSESELLEFLFLPSFSTATEVTETSGRGVGMDVVQTMVQAVGGVIHTSTAVGKGTTFHMQLPLTLSINRTLMVEISGEAYAFPIARVDRALVLDKSQIEHVEDKQFFTDESEKIGLLSAAQILELNEPPDADDLCVVVISDHMTKYGLVVDRFLGEHDLVVRPLDARLGKIQDVSSAAFTEEGTLILILDPEDLVHSIDALISGDRVRKVALAQAKPAAAVKRILVVDDSITVREVERKLLQNRGYDVEVAVDGVDGLNAVRLGSYDLVISDVDMPRMTGIELVTQIKQDPQLKSLPVMIVSYKDRDEDRMAGLEAGANYYLTKSSFRDETLIEAVEDLIGRA